jgi:hypothetical protein
VEPGEESAFCMSMYTTNDSIFVNTLGSQSKIHSREFEEL